MFLGGANHEAGTIRPPSVKGVLRFWWRALNWGEFYQASKGNEAKVLQQLHDREAELFGAAVEGKNKGGQGCFLLTVRHNDLAVTSKGVVHPNLKPTRIKRGDDGRPLMRNGQQEIDQNHWAAARYLGYGVIEAFRSGPRNVEAGQLIRSCINENTTFTVTLTFRNPVDVSVLNALKAMGLLGGLGSRSRHGMGSIVLESIRGEGIDAWAAPTSVENYDARIKELFSGITLPPTEPRFSAFWKESRVDRLLLSNTPYEVLDQFGEAMLMYRSWGKNSQVLGKPHEKRFKNDHDWYKNEEDPTTRKKWRDTHANFHPERAAFGLPHNYGQVRTDHVTSENHERRAGPLLFHVHRLSDTAFIGVSTYLPARFLPSGEKIKAGGTMTRGMLVPTLVPENVDMKKIIVGFLDGNIGDTPTSPKPTAPARFPAPAKKAVLP